MLSRSLDPRTEDTIVYDLLEGDTRVGTASFSRGNVSVAAPEAIRVAVEELLARPFVDRVQADERSRGYRRTASASVEMLIPGMPEHFMARMRGLWLQFPGAGLVTARPSSRAPSGPTPQASVSEPTEGASPVVDSGIRRSTLEEADGRVSARSLVRSPAIPDDGLRPQVDAPPHRSDCGWIV